ncbi:glycine receptor subunit alpha-2-like protein, partial [Leptotrombidium deliense]
MNRTHLLLLLITSNYLSVIIVCQEEEDEPATANDDKNDDGMPGDSEDHMLDNVDYPPFSSDDDNRNLTLKFFLEDVNSVNAKEMDFRIDYYMIQTWHPAEQYCVHYSKILNASDIIIEKNTAIISDWSFIQKQFWIPDTFMTTAKKVEIPSKLSDMRMLNITVRDLENNDLNCTMEYTIRLMAMVSCQMDFHEYPFDVQDCQIRFHSYDHLQLNYVWHPDFPINESDEIMMLNYDRHMKTTFGTIISLNDTYTVLI